ncbi:13449_t:CDS:2, partial [Entrophospora sp. SA101]
YSNNKSAWMTMQLWNNWLKWFDFTLEKKSVLLIDNCPAHTDEIADEPTSNDIIEELVDGLRINCTNNLTMSAEDFVNIDSSVITTELPTDEVI